MKIKSLQKILDKINLKQEINLIQLRKIIEKLELKNHRYLDTDIRALKNPKTGLFQITHFDSMLLQELLFLIENVNDRNSAAHQNMSHNHKVDGSFILIRQGSEHPNVVTIDKDGRYICPINQSCSAIVVENRQIFLYMEQFIEFLKLNTDIPFTKPLDTLFGAGNEASNSLHKKFLSSYDELNRTGFVGDFFI